MKIRWWICFFLFLTWLVSYIDRSLMPMALPLIGQEFHLGPTVMGAVISAFFLGYATMQIPGGMLADRIGARRSITLGIAFWSGFSVLTGAAANLANLIAVRICFGLGEGLHPAAAFKALSAWFPPRERARANGLVMSSNTLGPMIAPILFASLMGAFGWRAAFYIVSIPGFLIALGAYWLLRDRPSEHPGVKPEELAEIGNHEDARRKIPLSELLKYPSLWRLFFVYMTWDVTWWGFQAWLPSYLLKARGFSFANTGAFTALPFAAGFIGVLAAGWIADRTGKRKAVLGVVLLGIAVFMSLTATALNATMAVVFLTATGFFLPSIHGPFWSVFMDLVPSRVMGYSAGFINMGGQIAGIGSPIVIGALIQWTGHYDAGFIFMAASATISALLVATLGDAAQRVPSAELVDASSSGTRG
ncbi:MAG TPA: MFS transporter [Bryobacteraceae bacterium]|nr:MFS transporter [Bryobacteraceae bacterium]